MRERIACLLVAALAFACGRGPSSTPMAEGQSAPARVTREPFATLPDGRAVERVTLRSPAGVRVQVLSYGGAIASLSVPDREGRLADVVLGYDTLDGYRTNPAYLGGLIGRYANRIAHGRFRLDGRLHQLATNDGPHHLHGGRRGFDHALWRVETFEDGSSAGVRLAHLSPDGDEGYPGAVEAEVSYTLRDDGELAFDYAATSDAATVVNLTQHSYFDLSGGAAADVLDHELLIDADRYTPIDDTLIPTGELAPVAGTPLDFREARRIGARIEADHVQLRRGRGYDHNFVLRRDGGGLALAARLRDPLSGRTLEVRTTEPGLQFYSGNFLDGTIVGKGGRALRRRSGLCLETQHFPDSPNQPEFPPAVLRPGQAYRSRTVLRFSAR